MRDKFSPMRILIFGDIFGQPGRKILQKVIPNIRKEYEVDFIIANSENLAHGKGVTESSIREVLDAGVHVLTSGNEIWQRREGFPLLDRPDIPIIRPANYPPGVPGRGWIEMKVGQKNFLVVNLIGRTFMRDAVDCPFQTIDRILAEKKSADCCIIVDFHAEATSEKAAMGYDLDGKVACVAGTHTHVPTADERLLPNGTAFITDIGFTGPEPSIIGCETTGIIEQFRLRIRQKMEIPSHGYGVCNAVLLELNETTNQCIKIQRIRKIIPL